MVRRGGGAWVPRSSSPGCSPWSLGGPWGAQGGIKKNRVQRYSARHLARALTEASHAPSICHRISARFCKVGRSLVILRAVVFLGLSPPRPSAPRGTASECMLRFGLQSSAARRRVRKNSVKMLCMYACHTSETPNSFKILWSKLNTRLKQAALQTHSSDCKIINSHFLISCWGTKGGKVAATGGRSHEPGPEAH